MKEIALTRNKVALVDEDDFESYDKRAKELFGEFAYQNIK